MYNFQVEDFHTYHVGENGILVHNADGYSGTKKVTIRENNKRGNEYGDKQFDELKLKHPEAEAQLRAKPIDANGNAMKRGGNYFDGIAMDDDGNPFIMEYKASQTAPYTANQGSNGYIEGALNKPVVITSGNGVFPEGMVLPEGTPIITIRGD